MRESLEGRIFFDDRSERRSRDSTRFRPLVRGRHQGSLQARPTLRIPLDERRPVADGTIELPRWCREQSVSITAHRHGNTRAT